MLKAIMANYGGTSLEGANTYYSICYKKIQIIKLILGVNCRIVVG
jgi:hypothetical protein